MYNHFDKPFLTGFCYKDVYLGELKYELVNSDKKTSGNSPNKQNIQRKENVTVLLTFFVLSIAFSMVRFKSSKTDRTFSYSPKCFEK